MTEFRAWHAEKRENDPSYREVPIVVVVSKVDLPDGEWVNSMGRHVVDVVDVVDGGLFSGTHFPGRCCCVPPLLRDY